MAQPRSSTRHASPDADPVVDALARVSFATMAVLTKVASAHDLSLTQLRVLGILRDRQVRMAGLADHLGLERSTLSGLIDRAERRGLVVRSTDPTDGRAIEVRLSDEGARLAAELTTTVNRELSPLTDALGRRDREQLRASLERMLER
jgi:DNA-binding MarR family transcriptional regulator